MQTVKKSVLITGASSGIGRASVLQMSAAGWQVFATLRKPQEIEKLRAEAIAGVIPVLLDVEDRPSIKTAAEQITAQVAPSGLDGLVNVAGIGMVRPLEYATERDMQKIFDVNVFGQIAVIQAFLPLLRRNRGRIVNISSVGAHIAIPFGGLLNASKSAFGILSDTLRLELHPFGIRVITIEPGSIATPAVEKTLGNVEGVIAELPEQGCAEYGGMLRNLTRIGYQREMNGSPPAEVARAIYEALTKPQPRIRYHVGKDAKLLTFLPRILPDWLLDAMRYRKLGLTSQSGPPKTKSQATDGPVDRAA
ncbi:MAG TPA: SDR family oxidoreductase [Terriglobales bacterium]|nr:SDR family oxidoreductase [Terriglobales bacterium]